MKHRFLTAAVLLGILSFLCGCTPEEPPVTEAESVVSVSIPEPEPEPKGNTFRVGISLQDESPFVIRVSKRLQALLDEEDLGIEYVIYNAQRNANAQVSHVQSFISNEFDLVLLDPISYEECAPAVEMLQESGIQLIVFVTDVYNPDKYGYKIGSSHYESGVIEAQMAAEALHGKGKIVVLEGVMGISAQYERYRGYMDVLKDYPDIEIVAEQTAAWQKNEAYLIVQNWIRNKEFDAVLSENDNMALGAVEAVYEAGMDDEILVYGVDGDINMLYSVRNERADGTVYHDAIGQAEVLYEYIKDIMQGITPPEKEYRIPFEPVTVDNVDSYIEIMEKYG